MGKLTRVVVAGTLGMALLGPAAAEAYAAPTAATTGAGRSGTASTPGRSAAGVLRTAELVRQLS